MGRLDTNIFDYSILAIYFVLVIAIGVVLDWRTPGTSSDYSASAFRWAMCAQYPLWALGLLQVWRYRRRTRAVLDRAELTALARAEG